MGFSKTKQSLTEGPIFTRMALYVLPIMLTGILQLLYNMADHMVVGQFSGDTTALAAVGSTASLTNLIVNLFMGITAGAGVIVARNYGAKDYDTLSRAVHTSMLFALIGGIAFSLIGIGVSAPALELMGTKPEILEKATLYMRIICLGVPATAVYNFGATILRSVGDSKTPLYILSSSGLVNIVLNLFFVIVCGMSVDGVALATIISQYISAAIVVLILNKRKNTVYALSFKKLKIDKKLLALILRYGIPAGVQSSLFSISNVMITSAVNSFDTATVSGKTIAGNIDGLLYTALNSYLHAAMTFTAQNYGAGKPERIKRSLGSALLQVLIVGLSLSSILLIFGREFASLFIDAADPNKDAVISAVMGMLNVTVPMYFMCGVMETLSGTLRGLGYSLSPMVMSVGGICVLRIVWILTAFQLEPLHNIAGLYLCYPITWSATSLSLGITLLAIWPKVKSKLKGCL
ncbi:MAG: MATE family efflux transporter [Clostridia bacterium]|nr:MATE family efflux transporter [Clostridia bacterium]